MYRKKGISLKQDSSKSKYAPVVYAQSDRVSAKRVLDRLLSAVPAFQSIPMNELISIRELPTNKETY